MDLFVLFEDETLTVFIVKEGVFKIEKVSFVIAENNTHGFRITICSIRVPQGR